MNVQLFASANKKELCIGCQNFVTFINNRVGAQTDHADIFGYILSLATLLPTNYAHIVSNLAILYGNKLLDLVPNNQLCYKLKLC